MNIPINIYKDNKWNYIAESNILPWFHTYWKNQIELEKNLTELLALYKELIENWEVEIPNYTLVNVSFSNLEFNKNQNVRISC